MLIEQKTDVNEFRRIVIYVLYTVGIVGLKTQTNEQPSWTTTGRRAVCVPKFARTQGYGFIRCFGVYCILDREVGLS